MVVEDKGEYKHVYHLFAHYRDYDDVRVRKEFFEFEDVSGLENRIKELLLEGFKEDNIYVIRGQYIPFTTEKEVITGVKLVRDYES